MSRRRRAPRYGPPADPGITELTRATLPRTDLRDRPLRVSVAAGELVAQGWGGARASVPLAEIGALGAYRVDVYLGNTGGATFPRSGLLALDHDGRVRLRVTGVWSPDGAARLAEAAGVAALPPDTIRRWRDIGPVLRRRAPGYREIHTRARLLWLWYLGMAILLFPVPPLVMVLLVPVSSVAAFGGLIGCYLLCYLVGLRVPRAVRAYWRRRAR